MKEIFMIFNKIGISEKEAIKEVDKALEEQRFEAAHIESGWRQLNTLIASLEKTLAKVETRNSDSSQKNLIKGLIEVLSEIKDFLGRVSHIEEEDSEERLKMIKLEWERVKLFIDN